MAITTTFGKKAAAAALVALTLGAGMTANTGAAEARGGRNGIAAVGALAAVAGIALAASAAQAHAAPQYHGYDDGYAAPQPVYYRQQQYGYEQPAYEGYGYQPRHEHRRHYRQHNRYPGYNETGFAYRGPVCKVRRQQVFDGYGYRWQKVQVCR
jgi:hypothetical protein